MWWRLTTQESSRGWGEGNKRAFRQLVESGAIPGLLAYVDGQVAAWCAIEPREAYPRLNRSPTLKPVDDTPVWSVTCFFVAKGHRGKGVMRGLLRAATKYATQHGARIIEGYPVDARGRQRVYSWTGYLSTFMRHSFVEVARRSPKRPIVRYPVESGRRTGRAAGR